MRGSGRSNRMRGTSASGQCLRDPIRLPDKSHPVGFPVGGTVQAASRTIEEDAQRCAFGGDRTQGFQLEHHRPLAIPGVAEEEVRTDDEARGVGYIWACGDRRGWPAIRAGKFPGQRL